MSTHTHTLYILYSVLSYCNLGLNILGYNAQQGKNAVIDLA